ncbi:MAG: hypothetical protein QNL04_08255 [SAR324 cluster bacterium]|nr:hypothetical protein [SAR324 cluster bacterium]
MKAIALLHSSRAKSAYFNDYIAVSKAELSWVLSSCGLVSTDFTHVKIGEMDFFHLDLAADQEATVMPKLVRLSFVAGIFERKDNSLLPLDLNPNFALHEDFIYGAKFKGKTNETLTQLLVNIGLAAIDYNKINEVKLLDPMCGRGTTMLWALNYGCQAKGIEQEETVLNDVRQMIKKWTKIHRQKHHLHEGSIGAKIGKKGNEKFIDLTVNGCTMRVINGDSTQANRLLKNEKFHMLVTDLPYGVQHFTTAKTRNPTEVLKACASDWCNSLKPGGVMVMSFNNYIPKREELIEVFSEQPLEVLDFTAPHRMSESIVRDILVLKKSSI